MNIPLQTRVRKCVTTANYVAALAAVLAGSSIHVSAAPLTGTSIGGTSIGGATVLRGHIPGLVAQSQVVGRLDSSQTLSLALTLPLRNQVGLSDLLQRLYDPTDPQYGHYLTPEQFTARFGPTQADYDKAITYARAAGLTVTGTTPNRTILNVTGSAGQVEQAFGVQLKIYQSPEDGRYFYAPNVEPTVSTAAAAIISGIVGLDNAGVWHPHNRLLSPVGVSNDPLSPYVLPLTTGSGIGGGLTPSDIKTAYGLNGVTQTGTGQSLGLFELANYTTSDITSYETYFGLPNVPLTNVPVGTGISSNGADEVTLDIELQIALAPGASKVYVYEAPNSGTGLVNEYNKIVTDNLAKQISTSWGLAENSAAASSRSSENTAFQQMAAQGQSIFAAAGDSGAYDNKSTLSVDDPASQPYMTGVGGTTLRTNGGGGAYTSETTWNGGSISNGGGGGGISTIWSIPAYQLTAATASSTNHPAGGVSTTSRNVPDVSLNADPNTGYLIRYSSNWYLFGGTSCAAPLWAAFAALVNQQRIANGYNYMGFFNPALYSIANSSRYSTDFHDIADGSTNLYYTAVPGYDDATGLGTFNGANLLTDMVSSVPISGTISLQNVASGNLAQPMTFTITPTNTPAGATAQPVTTQTVTPAAADGSFTLYGVPAGTYTLGIKGSKWLRKDVSVDTTAGAVTGLNVSLLGGDANGDNQVTALDLLAVKNAYNSVLGSPNYNAAADFNCDGQVTALDLLIVKLNYNKTGDQ
jgi:subtilase family serine protease